MKTVFVGLSGGVDSAVSAALLKEAGHTVVGAFIKIWQPEFIECTWKEDRLDAMRVAAALNIPFMEIDLSESYKKNVIEDMLKGYAGGITPNPDILCNTYIKFGDFANWAFENGAEMVATGHYARVEERNGTRALLRGSDSDKDQSYFLYRIEPSILMRTLFPLGNLHKGDVRALARTFNLPNAERPDSQGLCFVGHITMKDFLRRFISVESGSVVDMKGAVIGSHEGAALYTIGQRHGFTVHATSGRTHYVVDVDIAANTLHVSEERADAEKGTVDIEAMHWLGETPASPFEAEVQTRYREKPVRAGMEQMKEGLRATLAEPHLVSPGQSAVLYDGERVLGGGIIT